MTRQSVGVILAVLMFLFSCSGEAKKDDKDAPKERVFDVKTIKVSYEKAYIDYTAVGWVESASRVAVRPEVSGRVVRVFAEEGQRVRADDVLLKIEDESYRAGVRELEENLKQAEKQLENAEGVYQRRKELFEKNLISQEEFESVKTQLEVARARVDAIRSSLERARINLKKTELRAGAEGVVEKRLVNVGDYVSPQVKVFEIVDTQDLRFVFRVPQEVRDVLRIGQEVSVSVGDKVFKGRVFYISPSASPSRLFTVKARLSGARGVSPGTFGEVRFRYKEVRAFPIPEQAVQLSGEQAFLWVVDKERAIKVPVRVVSHRGSEVLAVADLPEGSQVVVEGFMFLYEGARVRER